LGTSLAICERKITDFISPNIGEHQIVGASIQHLILLCMKFSSGGYFNQEVLPQLFDALQACEF